MYRKFLSSFKDLDYKLMGKYFAVFMGLFLFFLYLTFPYDAVKKLLLSKVEDASGLKIEVADVSTYKISGLYLKGLKMAMVDRPDKVLVDLPEARVRLYLSKLLLGKKWIDFDILGYGGGATGVAIEHKTGFDIAANFKDLDLNRYKTGPLLASFGNINLTGKVDGKTNAHIGYAQDGRQQKISGSIDLDVKSLKMTNSSVIGGKLPEINFKNSQIKLSLERKALSIREFKLDGDKLSIQLQGRISFQGNIENAHFNLTFKFKPAKEIEESLGPYMMTLKEPDSQGFYRISLTGTPGSLKFRM